MKKSIKIFIILLFATLALTILACDDNNHPELQRFSVKYSTDGNGYIEANATQTVACGKNALTVTAIPNEGYRFVKWSDNNNTNSVRTDINVTANINATAMFEKTFLAQYSTDGNGFINDNAIQIVTYGENALPVTAIPADGYEFEKWSDEKFDTATRHDLYVSSPIIAVAEFRCIFGGGYGTIEQPFLIDNYEQFLNIALFPDRHYKLVNDLNLSGKNHEPIFDNADRFEGIFDGNGKAINDLTIDSYVCFPSLFGFVGEYGIIKNINLNDFTIIVPDFNTFEYFLCVGAVAGVSLGILDNINVSGSITGRCFSFDGVAIGGIVGQATSLITNCNSDVMIDIDNVQLQDEIAQPFNVGGLIGVASGNIISCNANTKINVNQVVGNLIIGGLIGFFYEANEYINYNITDSFTYVDINGGTSMMSAGLIGKIATVQISVKIENCGTEGQITGSYEASGFIYYSANATKIKNSYSKVNITTHAHAAGFVGYFNGGTISNCYATGSIIAVSDWESNVAGFCYTSSNASFYQCYFMGSLQARGAAGFLYRMGGATSDELVEECFSTGTISATLFAAGFIFMQNGKIINCYSSTDINVAGMDTPRKIIVGGLCAAAEGLGIENSYYSGKIILPNNYSEDSSIIGAFIGILDGEGGVTNCAVVFQENDTINKVIFENYTTINPDILIYNTIMEANYLLAKLNNESENPVWMNGESGLPQLSFLLFAEATQTIIG